MRKQWQLIIREDVRLKQTIKLIADRMGITQTDFIRLAIRNSSKYYSKQFNVPYLANSKSNEQDDHELLELMESIKHLK
jgi:antitoxin component of RelBE/YafQ-DinJ toxin-antitoxin module